jgi:hypothetical protein
MPSTDVVHNVDWSRYELLKDGAPIGYAEYRLLGIEGEPAVAEFHHTVIKPSERGQGHAHRLVAAALDDVRQRGLRVRATCWYVEQFLHEHRAYADLRLDARQLPGEV